MRKELARVKKAAERKRAADATYAAEVEQQQRTLSRLHAARLAAADEYRAAVSGARDATVPQRTIAAAAGVSQQAIHKMRGGSDAG